MLSKSVGVYITKKEIDVVILSRALGKIKLELAAKVQIKAEGEEDPNAAVGAAIKELFEKHKIKERSAIVGLSAEEVVVRYFQMPRLSDSEQKSAITFEARKYLPYRLEDISSDFVVNYKDMPSSKMAVEFIACENATVNRYMTLLKEHAHIAIDYLEPMPFSLGRLFYSSGAIKTDETITLVYANSTSASINIFKNKILYLTRNIPLIQEIPAKIEEVDLDKFRPVFDALISEIRLSFDYFHRQFPDIKINKLLLCAEESFNNWVTDTGKELNIEAALSSPPGNIEGVGNSLPEFSIACGLALRKFYEPTKGTNLIPKMKGEELKKLLAPVGIWACVGVIFLSLVQLAMSKSISNFNSKLEQVTEKRSPAFKNLSHIPMEKIQNSKTQYQKQLGYIKAVVDERTSIAVKLDFINQLIPEGIWLSSISMEDPSTGRGRRREQTQQKIMLLTGSIYHTQTGKEDAHMELINQFLKRLRQESNFMEGFKEIKLESVTQSTFSGVKIRQFKIICVIE